MLMIAEMFHKRMAWPWALLLAVMLVTAGCWVWLGVTRHEMGAVVQYLLTLHLPLLMLVLVGTLEVWLKKLRGRGLTGKE